MAEDKFLYLVIQEGGSSAEHYPTLYDDEKEATRAAKGHRKASYRSTEPIKIPIKAEGSGLIVIDEAELIELIDNVRRGEYF